MFSEGIVIKSTGSFCTVRLSSGNIVECKVRGKFRIKDIKTTNPVAVGDVVDVEVDSGENTSWVVGLHERRNYIIRRSVNLSHQFHIIAANVDQAILIATVAFPRTSTGFIDRFLITAEAYSIPAKLVFNKIDLLDDATRDAHERYLEIYRSAGYECFETSSVTGAGIADLRDMLRDKVSLLSGHSGTGKSTLINAVQPGLELKTGVISDVHDKGKHTTTFAEMFDLVFGGSIVDTPGIKEFGLVEMEPDELASYYPDIYKYQHNCKFTNCMHENEPGCGVKQAVEEGGIAEERYINYLTILADLQEQKKNLY